MKSFDQERCRELGATGELFVKEERQVTLNLSCITWELIEVQKELEDLPLEAALSRLLEEWAANKFVEAMRMEETRQRLQRGERRSNAKYLYFMRRGKDGPIKIGVAEDVEKRRRALRTGIAEKLTVIGVFEQDEAINEKALHEKFEEHRQSGEWFQPAPEILKLIDDLKRRKVVDGSGDNQ